MPALNVQLTDAELTALRARASAEGRSMRTLAHDDIAGNTAQAAEDAKIAAAYARIKQISADLLNRLADR
ncbi:MAG TPA: hypothetical protein VLW50_27605 [Streptosporangiaceae bacterium]|nr:hypothetical protein [Streptosporangiaceae bacterium]